MVPRLLPLVLFVFLAAPVAARPGPIDSQAPAPQVRSERVKNGISHFDRAFYGSIPHKLGAEAAREFDLAIAEFEAELRANPASIDAHRYLARICAARRQFRQAAAHYDAIGRIDPADVDACVLAALAWLDAGAPGEARARLLDAKTRTTDAVALARLDDYLARLDRDHPIESK
jgi:tetratricopeptide (TPR) repeat protein